MLDILSGATFIYTASVTFLLIFVANMQSSPRVEINHTEANGQTEILG